MQGPIPRIHSPNINAVDFNLAGTSGRGMFRSTESGQKWQQINNGLLALYESGLAVNTMVTFSWELTLSAELAAQLLIMDTVG